MGANTYRFGAGCDIGHVRMDWEVLFVVKEKAPQKKTRALGGTSTT
jgi:hypothetical protein